MTLGRVAADGLDPDASVGAERDGSAPAGVGPGADASDDGSASPIGSLANCRAPVAVSTPDGNLLSWRFFATDPAGLAFNVYRDTKRLNPAPIVGSTNFLDPTGTRQARYELRPVLDAAERGSSGEVSVITEAYLSLPLSNPEGRPGQLVATADLDGDCSFDFIVKLSNEDFDVTQYDRPSNGEQVVLEAYSSAGALLWRRSLGPNTRPGVWFSPMTVYDFDGDGRAEVALKVGEIAEELGGDGDLNADGITDYSDALGNVNFHEHPDTEFLEVWDGATGATRARTPWIDVSPWGSDTNRYNRNMMTAAYLGGDGEPPSILLTRGGSGRNEIWAVDLVADTLVPRWTWAVAQNGDNYGRNLRAGDVDGDGRDEFLFFGRVLDDDGSELWNAGQGQGDRFHLTDIDPARPGLEVFYVQESQDTYEYPVHLRAAESGQLLWGANGDWGDVGRGLSANIDDSPGVESWGSSGDLFSADGRALGPAPSSVNMAVWWDGDLQRELLDRNRITKFGVEAPLLEASGCSWGSRDAPMGYGDVVGDWREEVWWLCNNNTELRIYLPTAATSHRLYSFMQDPIYRTSVASMSSGYAQSTQPGFYVGDDMGSPPLPYVQLPPGR